MTFFLVMFGIYFTMFNLFWGDPDYSLVLSNVTIVLLITIPIITMRLLSEERKSKTDQLILTSPVKVSSFVLGKYLSAFTLFSIITLITILQPLVLSTFTNLPVAKIVGGYIGVLLLGSTFIAIGLFLSSIAENQIVSALTTFGVFLFILYMDSIGLLVPKERKASIIFACILALIIGIIIYSSIKNVYISVFVTLILLGIILVIYIANPIIYDGFTSKFFSWFSLVKRYSNFSRGIFDLSSVVYYLSFSTVFVFLTIQKVEKRRWN